MNLLGAIDWSEVTAIATGALALLTFILAAAAIVAAGYAKRDIETQLQTSAEDLRATRDATEAAQSAVQRQIEASYRPLLIAVTETTSVHSDLDPEDLVLLRFPGGHEEKWDWRHVYVSFSSGNICVAVPLRNVGSGLAVIDVHGVRVVGDGVAREILGCEVHRERVPPGETSRILCTHGIAPHSDPQALQVLVPYHDYAGGQAAVADIRLECMGESYRVASIRPVAPGDIAL
jgi:hypothetical protein